MLFVLQKLEVSGNRFQSLILNSFQSITASPQPPLGLLLVLDLIGDDILATADFSVHYGEEFLHVGGMKASNQMTNEGILGTITRQLET